MSICTVYLRLSPGASVPVLLLSNRDEFDARQTAALHAWQQVPVVAGRDLKGGGTWLGMNKRTGRFATVLNVREGGRKPPADARTRGELASGFLLSDLSVSQWISTLNPKAYDGFTLLLGDASTAYLFSNRGSGLSKLDPALLADTPALAALAKNRRFGESSFYELSAGSFAISNGVLSGGARFRLQSEATLMPHPAWPKCVWVQQAADQLDLSEQPPMGSARHSTNLAAPPSQLKRSAYTASRLALVDQAMGLLKRDEPAKDADLPDTGVPKLLERRLSSLFVRTLGYGTQTSSVLMLSASGWFFAERTHRTQEQVTLGGTF